MCSPTFSRTWRLFTVQAKAPSMRNSSKFSVFSSMKSWKRSLRPWRKNQLPLLKLIILGIAKMGSAQVRWTILGGESSQWIKTKLSWTWIAFYIQKSTADSLKFRTKLANGRKLSKPQNSTVWKATPQLENRSTDLWIKNKQIKYKPSSEICNSNSIIQRTHTIYTVE